MSVLLLIFRLLLVAVLGVAGVGKLADRQGAREAARGFGVPQGLTGPVSALLPVVELVAAVLLVPTATAVVGAGLALALMLAFCAAIARSLARGEAPDCHCFGALHSEPAGPRTLIRNLVLAAAAAGVLGGGAGTSATHWAGTLSASRLAVVLLALALTGAVVAGLSFGLHMLRRNGELLLRIDELENALESSGLIVPAAEPVFRAGLPVGTPAPAFSLPEVSGGTVTLEALQQDSEELLLVFTDPACGPCSALIPQLGAWQRERPGDLRVVLVSRGDPEANRAHAAEHGLTDLLVQADREVSESFSVSATPSALVIGAAGTVATPVHAGEDQIRALVSQYSDAVLPVHRSGPTPAADPDPDPTSELEVGGPAPNPALRTLDGKLVRLAQRLPEGPALVLFWNPACGFCERMIDSVRALDAADSRLVLISTGSPAANRALGLRAPVLLDDGFAAGAAFGAMGTPSAVLIDQQRRIASPVAVGADAVLALAGGAVRADRAGGADAGGAADAADAAGAGGGAGAEAAPRAAVPA